MRIFFSDAVLDQNKVSQDTHLKYLACFERGTGKEDDRSGHVTSLYADHVRVFIITKILALSGFVHPGIPHNLKED